MNIIFHIFNSSNGHKRAVKINGINREQIQDYRALVCKGLADDEYIYDTTDEN